MFDCTTEWRLASAFLTVGRTADAKSSCWPSPAIGEYMVIGFIGIMGIARFIGFIGIPAL